MKTRTFRRTVLMALLVASPVIGHAQDWKSILKGVANTVEEKASEQISQKLDTLMYEGSWQYVKPDIKLQSDDILSQAGSELAAAKIEERMLDVLTKLGFNERTVFTFNADSTYVMTTDKRTLEGTYTFNKATREIVMTSRLQLQFTAILDQNILKPDLLSIRFNADKLMAFVKHVSGTLAQKSTYKSAAMANALLSKYNGLTIGFELKKK